MAFLRSSRGQGESLGAHYWYIRNRPPGSLSFGMIDLERDRHFAIDILIAVYFSDLPLASDSYNIYS